MACYHFTLKQVSRGKGASAVAKAAYHSGERLSDAYYGTVHDYTKKAGIVYKEIFLPPHAPEHLKDRETLWNEVEQVEKNKRAQLANNFEIALMNEFSMEDNILLAKAFVKEQFVARGMIADVAIHDPPRKQGEEANPHIHVMCPMRPLNEDGTWGVKQKKEIVLDENGQPVIGSNGKPKERAYSVTGWNSKETLQEYRKAWADMVNEEFQKKGMQERIDHRSYEAQGIMLIPQIHEGPNVRKMEAKGIRTEKGSLNRLIKEINQGILLLKEKVKDIMDVISELSEEMHRNEKYTKSDLSQCIQKYFADRNETAESYSYGKNKARKTNLKKMAELLVYLEEHHISTIEELNEHVKGKKAELGILGQINRRKKADIAGIKENLRYLNWYEEGIPVIGEIEKRKFNKAKERIKAENGDTLRRYHIAKRILTERGLLGKMDKNVLQQEICKLENETKENYVQYKALLKDIKQLQDICMFSRNPKEQKKQKAKEENSL